MERSDRLIIKAGMLPFISVVLWMILSRQLPGWSAAVITGTAAVLLFHWLPPRIHDERLTVPKSIALSLLAGALAAAGATLVDVLFDRFL